MSVVEPEKDDEKPNRRKRKIAASKGQKEKHTKLAKDDPLDEELENPESEPAESENDE